ncbi:hypothetical protein [Streptomyces sp. NPDC102360]|uniref:hypothetical protein n=1 Tax=Streptomyces sp. NPDC102360 TaxID=3366160 RepID=UPI003827A550
MRIVGIHGINQHRQRPEELEKAWRDVLTTGLRSASPEGTAPDIGFELVFYADLFDEHRDDWKGDQEQPIDPVSEPGPAALLAEWAQALDSVGAEVPHEEQKGVGVPAIPLWTQAVVQRLAASPGLQGFGEAGVQRLARHMHAYLSHPDARHLIWERLERVMRNEPPTVLIGHSMGSVVAYEWLHGSSDGDRAELPLLVTAGSPLGCGPIVSRLSPPPSLPPGFGRWVNIAGRYDPVAWPKQLAPLFGAAVQDESCPFRPWAHNARTYLASRPMADAVLGAPL